MMVAGGKPHWAKNFLGSTTLAAGPVKKDTDYDDFEMRGMALKVEEWYGEDLKKFRKIRKEQDPDNVFLANKQWAIINGIIDPSELSD